MKLKYDNKEIELVECRTFYKRLMGFMFKKNIKTSLLFNKCNSIHTFFMKEPIQVILCNKDNKIIKYYNNLDKGKVILPIKNVSKIFECPANYFNNLEINKEIEIIK